METNYTESLKEISKLISTYPEIRRIGCPEDVQELRDRLSECLFHFGPIYAHIRSQAERADANYKTCLEEKKKYWKAKYGAARGTGVLVETDAYLDCKDMLDILNDRNEDFYLAKSLVERTDQILNSISSRLKLTIKHE